MFRCILSFLLCFLAIASGPLLAQKTNAPFPVSPEQNFFPSTNACATDVMLKEYRKTATFRKLEEKMNQQKTAS